eukprot:m.174654 g.174654  ORF g.174654 m.174654 type:complete len:386 (+) comp15410_c0_seq4:253-1410(+)
MGGLPSPRSNKIVRVYNATKDWGTYSHGAMVSEIGSYIVVSWKCHARDEDAPGMRNLYSVSNSSSNGLHWSEPNVLFPNITAISNRGAYGAGMHPLPFTPINGHWYAFAQAFETPTMNDLPLIARRVYYTNNSSPLSFGPVFWVSSDVPKNFTSAHFQTLDDQDSTTKNDFQALHSPARNCTNLISLPINTCPVPPAPNDRFKAMGTEHTFYSVGNTDVLLMRDGIHCNNASNPLGCKSWVLWASVRESKSGSWSVPAMTTIPDDISNLNAGKLRSGSVFLVNDASPISNFTHCKSEKLNGEPGLLVNCIRDPLVLSVARDGVHFSSAWAIASGFPKPRYVGLYKNWGPSYPQALLHDESLVVAYSVNKEDIYVSIIAESDLEIS